MGAIKSVIKITLSYNMKSKIVFSILNSESPQIKELKEDDADKEKENQGEKEEKLKDLTEKLNGANKRLFETKNEVQQLKHELKLAHKVG